MITKIKEKTFGQFLGIPIKVYWCDGDKKAGSNYEKLCMVVNKLDEVITRTNQIFKIIERINEDLERLHKK